MYRESRNSHMTDSWTHLLREVKEHDDHDGRDQQVTTWVVHDADTDLPTTYQHLGILTDPSRSQRVHLE